MIERTEIKIDKLGFSGAIGKVLKKCGGKPADPEFHEKMTRLLNLVGELFPTTPYFGIIVDGVMCEAHDSKQRELVVGVLSDTLHGHLEALDDQVRRN